MNDKADYPNWSNWIPQAPSSYEIHCTCQLENFGWLLEQLPKPFGIFDQEYKGRIVEVGAFDGVTYSNTWGLIKAGWSALLIEPMVANVAKCYLEHQNLPWVMIAPVGCGEKAEMIPMFFEREGSRLAKTDEEKQQQQMIRVVTLNSLLKVHHIQPDFDMLVIDTEDYELQVLKGFDLEKWRPKLAIIETHGPLRKQIHKIFNSLYSTFYEDGLNTMFTRRDWKP